MGTCTFYVYTHTHVYLNVYVGICKYAVICNASPRARGTSWEEWVDHDHASLARCMAIFSASNFVALTRMVRRTASLERHRQGESMIIHQQASLHSPCFGIDLSVFHPCMIYEQPPVSSNMAGKFTSSMFSERTKLPLSSGIFPSPHCRRVAEILQLHITECLSPTETLAPKKQQTQYRN